MNKKTHWSKGGLYTATVARIHVSMQCHNDDYKFKHGKQVYSAAGSSARQLKTRGYLFVEKCGVIRVLIFLFLLRHPAEQSRFTPEQQSSINKKST